MLFVFGLFVVGAAWKASDASRQWGADLAWAIGRAKLLKKQVALALDMDQAQFSRDLTEGRLYGGRVAELPTTEIELLKIRAARYGLQVVDRDVGCLLTGMSELLGRRKLAKMELQEAEDKERSA